MRQVEFRVGVADPLGYACALLRTAVARGARLVVRADAADLDDLDARLWTFSQVDFVAHCRAGDALAARTPVLLTAGDEPAALAGRDCLVNLAAAPVPDAGDVPRVIELVGADEPAKAAGRARFRAWRDAGVRPTTMEVQA